MLRRLMMQPMRMSQTSSSVTWPAAELFGDDGQGGGRRLADAQGQVAGRPAHADDEIPARGGARVLGQVADDADADLAGRLEAERRRRAGQGQVVVDGLGHVGDADRHRRP